MQRCRLLWFVGWVLLVTACAGDPVTANAVSDSALSNDTVDVSLPEITSIVVEGAGRSAEALDGFPVEGAGVRTETIDHVVTVVRPEGDIWVYYFNQTSSFCYATVGNEAGAMSCASNDQLASGKPFLRPTSEKGSGEAHVWVSNAPETAVRFVVETETDETLASQIANRTGYTIVPAGSTPVEAFLVDAEGDVLWSGEVR